MKLDELIEEFDDLDAEERLELLVEFSETLPSPSGERAATRPPEECRVQECQTPVYLWVELAGAGVHLEADVPRQSPVVRGIVALLVEGLEGAEPAAVVEMEADLLARLGLEEALGMTRHRGVRGLVGRIRREVAQLLEDSKVSGG